MKSFFLATLLLTSINSHAAMDIFCQGITDTDKTLLLFVNESKIVQVRVQTQGSLPKAFGAREIQKDSDRSLYTLTGTSEILSVQNSVLEDQGGVLDFANEKFDCE